MDEESNNRKLTRLLPELQKISIVLKKAGENYDKTKILAKNKYKVRIGQEEGYFYVSAGGYSGAFDLEDKDNDELPDIPSKEIKNRINTAGKALRTNFIKWHNAIYSAFDKFDWMPWDENEGTLQFRKDGLIIDIAGSKDNYLKFIVISPIERCEVGHAARHYLDAQARAAKYKKRVVR